MDEIIETIEVKSTKYVLLSIDKYKVLNEQISEAMGFDVGKPTERYAPIDPILAKTNIQFESGNELEDGSFEMVEMFDKTPVMPITARIQEKHNELLIGLDLVDSYVPYVEELID